MGVRITFVQSTINRFNAGLMDDGDCTERWAHGDCRKMLHDHETWMAKRIFEAHQTHFEAFIVTMKS